MVAAAVMSAVIVWLKPDFAWWLSAGVADRVAWLSGIIALAAVAYFVVLLLLVILLLLFFLVFFLVL